MKAALTQLFAPILNAFDRGDEPYRYVPSHRKITIAVGVLFLVLAVVSLYLTLLTQGFGAVVPLLAFLSVGVISVVVGCLGTERAIAKIWGTK